MDIFLLEAFHWTNLLQPQFYIENGGLWLLLFVVFAETGLFVGFFLPGDSLLFVAGIYAHEITKKTGEVVPGLAYQFLDLIGLGGIRNEWVDLFVLVALISFFGILGNAVGYWTGRKIGPAMYTWKDRFLFKKRYLEQAHEFYMKHGGLAIIGARFLPFIRTFAPIVAGIVKMDQKKFHFFNIVGCIAWVFSMIFAGYFLQKWILSQFGFDLKEHLELIVLGIVLVTTAPVLIKIFTGRKKKTQDTTSNDSNT
ncbi:MAG TPA: VTT domain-containing protein [Chitinophagaceae bacterium]